MQPSLFASVTTLTVGELMRHLQTLLSEDDVAQDVGVRGEISNFTRAASGHLYFSLKDHDAAVRCVMWKTQAVVLSRLPQNGESVQAQGYISLYEARGDLQLYVDRLTFDGVGILWQQLEALKKRLQSEGLFEDERKRSLPRFPSSIGLVTSDSGAALQDMLRVFRTRWPLAEIVLAPCQVQGADAPRQIVRAIRRLNRLRDVAVIVVARGGGSIEDLWAFNDEAVARAICASRQPVVSGVGHETDNTIADFVADKRAATPTAAAATVTPARDDLAAGIAIERAKMARAMRERIGAARAGAQNARGALARLSPRDVIATNRQRVDDLQRALAIAVRHALAVHGERLRARRTHLEAVSPQAVLARGYAIVRRDGHIISQVADARAGDRLRVRVSDGEFGAVVNDAA